MKVFFSSRDKIAYQPNLFSDLFRGRGSCLFYSTSCAFVFKVFLFVDKCLQGRKNESLKYFVLLKRRKNVGKIIYSKFDTNRFGNIHFYYSKRYKTMCRNSPFLLAIWKYCYLQYVEYRLNSASGKMITFVGKVTS